MGKPDATTLLFSTIEGELLRPRNVTKAWSRIVPDKKFHSLRHTHASMLINAGVDILTISRRLGHSKAAITLDVYGHLMHGADKAAAQLGLVAKHGSSYPTLAAATAFEVVPKESLVRPWLPAMR